MSSIEPIRPVGGPRELQPFRRRRREEPAEEQTPDDAGDPPAEDEPEGDARPSIDLRA